LDIPSSFSEIKQQINNGQLNLVDLCQSFIKRIESSKTNAFVEIFKDESLKRAALINEKINQKKHGLLAGMIIGVKDNICFANHKVTASSKILSGFESIFSATAIQRLLDEDAIIIGRLNCDEFAMGSSN